MGFRRFVDREGREWEIRVRGRSEWEFVPVANNPGPGRTATAPGYEGDPFELSAEELQRLLDVAPLPRTRAKPSPFNDESTR
ncbi:MAG TPA: hypothetical protein VF970_10445 [Gemmatimonadales bacterium]